MKKLLVASALLIMVFSCSKKDDETTPAPTGTNSTITQDSRLLGGWRLDSMQWGSTMSYSIGNGQLTDSINLVGYAFNGNIPIPDLHYFFISNGVITPLPDDYFWDTTNDSMFIRIGNHMPPHRSAAYKFILIGNRLILHWDTYTLDHYWMPPNPRVAISYYHR